jgi:hypothetical protein
VCEGGGSEVRQRRAPMANVVRRTWTEVVDDKAFAAVAEFSETWHGMIFAASTFLLAERKDRWQVYGHVEQKLAIELERGHHCDGFRRFHRHGMPMVSRTRDLNRP